MQIEIIPKYISLYQSHGDHSALKLNWLYIYGCIIKENYGSKHKLFYPEYCVKNCAAHFTPDQTFVLVSRSILDVNLMLIK